LPFSDTRQALEDIVENIARIERFAAGHDINTFRNDEGALFSTQYALLVITEPARRLGDQADILCPDVPWKQIRGLGNWLRHGYDRIDPLIIWNTVQNDLRPLQLSAAFALKRLEDERRQEPG
jgi:uncharacterized protein with HEPN domain